MNLSPQDARLFVGVSHSSVNNTVNNNCRMPTYQHPQSTQESKRPGNSAVVPLQRLVRRRCKHSKHTDCIGTITINQFLRINSIVLGFRHRRPTDCHQLTSVLAVSCCNYAASPISLNFDLVRGYPLSTPICYIQIIGFGQHHPLTQQVRCRFITRYHPRIAHQLVPETKIQQVEYRMFDATDVIVHR